MFGRFFIFKAELRNIFIIRMEEAEQAKEFS